MMSKLFKCQTCGSNEFYLSTSVSQKNLVEYDHNGNIIYSVANEPECEKVQGYACSACGHYLTLHGVVITDEKTLMEYLEKIGIGAA